MITIAQIHKAYGSVVALDGVSLEISAGERVAFVGANGSGKTTLLRAILGLVRFEGRITLGGADVAKEPEVALRTVAYIPQIAPRIDIPVNEVVRVHSALRGNTVDEVYARAARLGLDVAPSLKKRFRDLSGGMKQKLLAAMALSSGAPILVCDEPTANLDGEARVSFFEQISERPKGTIVVLCSHRVEEVRQLVSRVVELRDGRIVRDAPLDEVLRDLRAFRVEVVLRDAHTPTETLLLARGFVPAGPRRFVASVAQHQKLETVAFLLRDRADDVVDVSVFPAEDILSDDATRTPAVAPSLRLVGGR